MTDQSGPDGANRLELLEELLTSVARWSADGHDRRLPGVLDAFNAIIELDESKTMTDPAEPDPLIPAQVEDMPPTTMDAWTTAIFCIVDTKLPRIARARALAALLMRLGGPKGIAEAIENLDGLTTYPPDTPEERKPS